MKIEYQSGVDPASELDIVHFAGNSTEVITDVVVSPDGKEIVYEQDSFSVTGTIQTGNPTNGGLYMVLVKSGNLYYMVNNDGSLIDCRESGSTLRFLLPLFAQSGRECIFTGRGRRNSILLVSLKNCFFQFMSQRTIWDSGNGNISHKG